MIQSGDRLRNRYEILELVGRGGMADVYLAFDQRRQVQVAVKVLREDLAEDPEFLHRFAREAEALAQLDHPNIVRFYSFERQGATAFMVMDFVKGTTLRRLLLEREGPMSEMDTTTVLRQVGAALHYAHTEGIIHRDLKPGNVMIGDDGRVLLADFGIAKAMESATVTTVAVGTPAYMSPEQILGKSLDARTDIYSLGVMLYQMATGQRPFTGREEGLTGTGTLSRLRDAHLNAPPPDPRSINPSLSAEASAVIGKSLAKEPSDRWPDIISFVRAWETAAGTGHEAMKAGKSLVQAVPVAPASRSSTYSSQQPLSSSAKTTNAGSKRGLWVSFGVVVILVAAIAIVSVFLLSPDPPDSTTVNTVTLAQATETTTAVSRSGDTATATETTETTVATATDTIETATAPATTADATETAAAEDTKIAAAVNATGTAVAADATRIAAAVNATGTAEAAVVAAAEATRTAAAVNAQSTETAVTVAAATRSTELTATAQAAGPPACNIPLGGAFGNLWRQRSVYSSLGCPIGNAHQSQSATERFQRGFMTWRDSADAVYVLFVNGTWLISTDHFIEGIDPEYSCGVHESPPSPRRGFSKIWCNHPGVRSGLGDAVEYEKGYGMAGGGPIETFQDFEGGMMFKSNHFGAVYALSDDRTWRR